MRGELKKTRTGTVHKCFLMYPDEDVWFDVSIRRRGDTVRVGPVNAHGINPEYLDKTARSEIHTWAKSEAIRVTCS